MQEGKVVVRGGFKIAEERRKVKGKRERERYTQLNEEFQWIARRDNSSLSEQCKELKENNRMGKTSDLFEKIGDIKGTFHASMGMIKGRNGKNTQKYCTKKVLMTWIIMMVWSLI